MNTLIGALYVAEMLEKWQAIVYTIAIGSLIVGGILIVIYLVSLLFVAETSKDAANLSIIKSICKYAKVAVVIAIISGSLYSTLPKKEVVYIAIGLKASEHIFTEVMQSPKIAKISTIIDNKLDEIIANYKGIKDAVSRD